MSDDEGRIISRQGWFGGVISRVELAPPATANSGGASWKGPVAFVTWDHPAPGDPEWVAMRDSPYWHGSRLGSWQLQ